MSPAQWIQQHQVVLLEELKAFLRFPSISAQPAYRESLYQTAHWLTSKLQELGFAVELLGDPPVVHAWQAGPEGAPTLLFYGHYDVQPPEPLELWHSHPYEPRIEAGAIYASGASDDKGQVFAHLAAWRYWKETQGTLPVSLHVVIEGQEETGSETLYQVLSRVNGIWESDAIVVSDTAFFSAEVPTLTVGLRGLIYTEIEVTGPVRDLHSGSFGGVVENPIMALCRILTTLKGPDGRIHIPGFYEEVLPPRHQERLSWAKVGSLEEHYQQLTGAPALYGEAGFTPLERIGVRPTLEINGIWGGYTGVGSKTVLPSKAFAKVSMRLVPRQDPYKIWASFRDYIYEICPPHVEVKVRLLHEPAPAFETPTESPFYQAAEQAIERAFGKGPLPLREGGSIPVLSALQKAAGGAPVVLMGFGLPDDCVHSPNERFRLEHLWKGIEAASLFYELAAQVSS
ncbi:MAG: dipeptidase [Bacteroidia bacterium]|nr:dipeptidase [Bacteroidia bacterium]MDW8235546.1 dipeptidase [Bacteroidia bacterium]